MSLGDISSKAWLQNSPAARLERAKRYLGTHLCTHPHSTYQFTSKDFGSVVLNQFRNKSYIRRQA